MFIYFSSLQIFELSIAIIYVFSILYFYFYLFSIYIKWSQFLADIGGNVGLWIGASIFTVLEILELLTKMGVSKVQGVEHGSLSGVRKKLFHEKRRRNNKKRNNNQQEVPLQDIQA